MKKPLILVLLLLGFYGKGQVSIHPAGANANSSSMLDITSSNKGVLFPRMSKSERDLIVSPANSLIIYQTDNVPGYYYNSGTTVVPQWVLLESSNSLLLKIGRIPIENMPFTINQAGSYYLTTSFVSAVGITINVSNVTIDLNGNTLAGSVANTSAGITTPAIQKNITVLNGTISNWGKEGIDLDNTTSGNFQNLNVNNNALDGINVGKNSTITNVIAFGNTLDGIDVGESSLISYCVAESNLSDGFEMDHGGNILSSTAKSNIGVGVKTINISVITNCNAYANTSHGFQLGNGSTVTYNTASNNGGSGFYSLASCRIEGNNSRSNTRHGYEIFGNDNILISNSAQGNSISGFRNSFDRCQFISNTSSFNSSHGFDITANNCLIIKNTCTGNVTSDFNIGAGSTVGTVITAITINTNTNPNANISF